MKALVQWLLAWGPAGLFVIAIMDGAGFPIPSAVDILLVTIASVNPGAAYAAAICAVAGSLIGCFILFSIARKGGEMYLHRHSLSRGGAKFRQWFQHYGLLTIFISALVPLPVMPVKIFVLCAGALGSPLPAFLITLFVARLLRYIGLAYLGSQMGSGAMLYLRTHVWQLAAGSALLFAVLFVLVKISDRRRLARTAAS